MISTELSNLKTTQRALEKKTKAKRIDIERTSGVRGTQQQGLPARLEFQVMSLTEWGRLSDTRENIKELEGMVVLKCTIQGFMRQW